MSAVSEPVRDVRGAHLSTCTVGTLQQDVTSTWIVSKVEHREQSEHGTCLCSQRFHAGSKLWQLRLSTAPEGRKVLSLEDVGGRGTFHQFTGKFSITDAIGTYDFEGVSAAVNCVTPSVNLYLTDDLKVVCKLHLQEVAADASPQAESKSGADALARDFEKLLSSGEATDATIRVKGEREFHVHRAVLVARTPVFASMFRHQMSESKTGDVDVEDCDPDTFRRFLHYVYTGSVEDLRPEDAVELFRVADKYQVDELRSRCLECLMAGLSVQSFCPTMSLALQHSEKDLTERATEFFIHNVDEIGVTVQWQEFLSKNPIQANELFLKSLKKKNALLKDSKKGVVGKAISEWKFYPILNAYEI